MISGTYVLTDTINSAFDSIFNEFPGHRCGRHREVRLRPRDGSCDVPRRRSRAPLADRPCHAGVARREGGVDGESDAHRQGREGDHPAARRTSGSAIAPSRLPLNSLVLVGGDWPRPGPDRHRPGDGQEEGLRSRRPRSGSRPRARSRTSASPAGPVRRRSLDRRRDPLRLRPPDRAAPLRQEGGSTRSRSPPSRACRRRWLMHLDLNATLPPDRPGAKRAPSRPRRTPPRPTSSSASCSPSCPPSPASHSS